MDDYSEEDEDAAKELTDTSLEDANKEDTDKKDGIEMEKDEMKKPTIERSDRIADDTIRHNIATLEGEERRMDDDGAEEQDPDYVDTDDRMRANSDKNVMGETYGA